MYSIPSFFLFGWRSFVIRTSKKYSSL